MQQKQLLVTTADERTWSPDSTILFLGEWCRLYSRRERWDRPANSLHHYHWDDRQKYYRDYLALEALYEKKLRHIAGVLNEIHGLTEDTRYWRIIIGPWLRFFMDALFDRFETVRTAALSGSALSTVVLKYDLDDWIPADFREFYADFTDDPWNHIVFAECIRQFPEVEISENATRLARVQSLAGKNKKAALIARISRLLPSWATRIAIVSVNMPVKNLFKLQLALRQAPYLVAENIRIAPTAIDKELRGRLNDAGRSETTFEELLNKMVMAWIPAAYVENFAAYHQAAIDFYPSNPTLIFTANAFQADEGFKFWTATHTSKGVPFVISQHGGNMGIARYNQSEDHQAAIADHFMSWGWLSTRRPSVKPLPAVQLTRDNPGLSIDGDILVTVASYPRYFYCQYSVPVAGQFVEYIDDIERFIAATGSTVRSCVKIRTTADSFGWEIRERFRAAGLGKELDDDEPALFERLKRCRICIGTYNATIFLEMLAVDFPTIVFLNPHHFEIREEASEMMNKLRSVGILHDTAESAAGFLNKIAADIPAWWNDPELQAVRRQFCSRYALRSAAWMNDWKVFFKNTRLGN